LESNISISACTLMICRPWGHFTHETARVAGFPVIAPKIEEAPINFVTAFLAIRPLNSAMNNGNFSSLTGIQPHD
jgi:hypothetical protein